MSGSAAHLGGDHEVLSTLLAWLAAGEAAALVTVLRTWGSSPRPPGALLAMRRRDGRMVGSVSGGCVEADLVERYTRGEIGAFPTTLDYGVDPAGAARLGLPCGGQLELLIEEPAAGTLRPALAAITAGETLERCLDLGDGRVTLRPAGQEAGLCYATPVVSKVFGPQWRLILIGAGQLADHVARIALSLEMQVILCDPRPGFHSAVAGEVPGMVFTRQMPDDLIAGLMHTARTAVIALAHDPKLDDLGLLEALPGSFYYVGALGSLRSSAARRERLRSLGIGEAALARLHAPVGLDIGSHTPAEIAVSIAADLVASRRRVQRAAEGGVEGVEAQRVSDGACA
jgi:xanthine dehydrogenase accessory factor